MSSFEWKVPLSGRLHVCISHMTVKGGWGTSSGRRVLQYIIHPEITDRFNGLWDPFSLMLLQVSLVKIRVKSWDMYLKPWLCRKRDLSELGLNLSSSSNPHSCIGWYFLKICSHVRGARAVNPIHSQSLVAVTWYFFHDLLSDTVWRIIVLEIIFRAMSTLVLPSTPGCLFSLQSWNKFFWKGNNWHWNKREKVMGARKRAQQAWPWSERSATAPDKFPHRG